MIDFMEFYLLNYFKPALGNVTNDVNSGFAIFQQIGCGSCHIQVLTINRDRRVADVETRFDPTNGNPFNRMFATATPLLANPSSIGQAGVAKVPAFAVVRGDGTSSPTSSATISARTSTSATTTARSARSSSRRRSGAWGPPGRTGTTDAVAPSPT